MLAQATGDYRESPLAGPLAAHFACIWAHRLPLSAPSAIVIPPDGHIDVQWVEGAFRIAGPDRSPQTEHLASGSTIIGFRFHPGAAQTWLGVPASELTNGRLALADLWGPGASRLSAAVDAENGLPVLIASIEAALACHRPSVASDHAMAQAFSLVLAGPPPGSHLIPWLMGRLELSERNLRRRFDEAFGYGPKTLDRILRFQRYLKLARGTGTAADQAAEAGYADQAHLTREARRLAGSTPAEIARMLTPAAD